MDTSEEYIKMCDCPEIQGKWKIGMDEKAHPATDPHDYAQMIFKPHPKYKTQQACITIWLPRQDQIQEMMGWHMIKAMSFFSDFFQEEMIEQVGIGNQPKKNPKFNSMEQLWLAFYMQEKHKKIWNGKKWVA